MSSVWTPRRPLPFCYQSTGVETRFTNLLEPDARSRPVFAFHKPETLGQWIQADLKSPGSTVRGKLRTMPPLQDQGLWPAQKKAILRLEESLAQNRPRALIQMATGSGKTFTACNFSYRLIKFAAAKRILFLVDRRTLGRQTLNEFQQFITPDDGRKFTELYNSQLLSSNKLDLVSKVCITTIQRLYSMLVGREITDDEEDERPATTWDVLTKLPDPVTYNPAFPIETFDFIVTDECHRSIYHLWRQVLEYFDASLIGLTATPSSQTLGFFNRNLVMDYNHTRLDQTNVSIQNNKRRLVQLNSSVLEETFAEFRDDVCDLGEISDIQGGIQKQPKNRPVKNIRPFLRVANVLRGRLNLQDVHGIEVFGSEAERLRLEAGDLLIVEGNGSPGEIGRMAIWDGSIADCIHQNHIIRARLRPNVLPGSIEAYWNSPTGSRAVRSVASSTSGLHTLSVNKVKQIPCPVPTIERQETALTKIDRITSTIEATTRALEASSSRAARLRQAILAKAFSGQLVPQDPNDEPASILLDRIRAERNAAALRGETSAPQKRRL